jgi:predicted Fe-Mo cluster-binding NifX family protein
MRIAVTYEDGKVFQHFGRTESFKIYDVEDGKVTSSKVIDNGGHSHESLGEVLTAEGVNVLICGGIGGGAREMIASRGINLVPGAEGDTDRVVEDFLAGMLKNNPDCQCGHHCH